jgi:hypothetical protein
MKITTENHHGGHRFSGGNERRDSADAHRSANAA